MKTGTAALVTIADPQSPAAEAYRTLRTNLQFSTLDKPVRTVLVTSAGPDEGKSTTLCNLAVTIAQAGTKVLVVDCDLRRPVLHELLDLSNEKGLTTALIDENSGRLPLQQTAVPNLSALTSGPLPPNPADLLGSQRMLKVLEGLTAAADLVLLDSPPVTLVADGAILASRTDGVVLVVGAGRTRRDLAARAKAIIEKANGRILGAVLNNVRLDQKLYGYYSTQGR